MKKLFGLVLLLVAGAMVIDACKDDIVLPEPPSLTGTYAGVYVLKTGEGINADSTFQAVTWTFDSTKYFMDADTASDLFNDGVCFCKGRGSWAITDRVRLEPDDDRPIVDNCETCDPSESPQGSFTIEQPDGNLKLTLIEEDDLGNRITKRLELIRVEEEDAK